MYNGKRSNVSKSALLILTLFLPLLIISPVRAQQDLQIVLVRAQYSTSIGGQNEPIRDVLIGYKPVDSTEWFSVITNENGQSYIALEEGSSYELIITMNDSQKQVLLEYINEAILLISIDMNDNNIVGCNFISAYPAESSGLPFFSFYNFTLHLSHTISFFLGLVLTIIFIRLNNLRKQI